MADRGTTNTHIAAELERLVPQARKLEARIAELEKYVQILQDCETRHRVLLESFPLGVVACDCSGQIIEVNAAALWMLGSSPAEGARSVNLITSPLLVRAGVSDPISKCVSTGEATYGEFTVTGKGSGVIHGQLRVAPIRDGGGRIMGAQALIEDVTEKKRAEDTAIRSQKLAALEQIASGVSHAVSNLLQVVIANANIAYTNIELEEYPEVKPNLEQILEGARSATEAVRRLQQFGRIRAPSEAGRKRVFDLSEAAMEGLEMGKYWAKSQLERNKLALTQHIDLAPGCLIEGEPDQIIELVFNLFKYAAEALPLGGALSVKTFMKDDQPVLWVDENGTEPGKQDLESLLNPPASSRELPGAAGIAACRAIVRRHGASMSLKKTKPKGTAFIVRFPKSKEAVEKPKEVPKQAAKPKSTGKQAERLGLRLLLIDDDKAIINTLVKGLKRRGNNVYSANSGRDGLKLLEDNAVDAVVCDLGMEGMNGWEVSTAVADICEKRKVAKPPFILLTGWGGQLADDEILLHRHVDRIVEKPVTLPSLVEIINEELRKSETLA
jgi:PAS domain S-box-containing protein